MSNRDIGIRALIPGRRSPDEIKEDQNTRRYIETIVNQRAPVRNVEPFGTTLVRTTPSLNLGLKPRDVTKEPRGFISKKEYENHLINSPTKQDHERAFNMGNKILKVSEATKTKMADEHMRGGGRDPNGRSLDQEIKLGKENWLKNQRTIGQLKALKEHHQPKSKAMPVTTYVDKMNVLYSGQEKRKIDDQGKPLEASKGGYTPWYERMAAEEAEALNNVKRKTWEQGGKVNPPPKLVTAQNVQDVYDRPKKLHQRLENHNERTVEFKSTVEKPTHKPRFLHNPVTNELEDTYDPNWGDDILNEKK